MRTALFFFLVIVSIRANNCEKYQFLERGTCVALPIPNTQQGELAQMLSKHCPKGTQSRLFSSEEGVDTYLCYKNNQIALGYILKFNIESDGRRKVIEMRRPKGNSTKYSYNPNGNLRSLKHSAAKKVDFCEDTTPQNINRIDCADGRVYHLSIGQDNSRRFFNKRINRNEKSLDGIKYVPQNDEPSAIGQ